MMRGIGMISGQRRGVLAVFLGLMLGLGACSQPKHWALQDINGVMSPLKFSLIDDTGKAVTESDYHGKIVLLYFGYTHCPDICPATLGTVALALHQLGTDADKVRVLFVSVDPKRDTTAVLKQYVNAFGPQFVGLSGTDDQLESLAKRYRVAYSRDKPDTQGNYTVTHSSAVFIFDGEGKSRLLALSASKATDIAHDLRLLIPAG
jgi:protein SCO1/2